MRLLECSDGEFKLTKDLVHDIPRYAILSHTWGLDPEEATFRDLVDCTGVDTIGYKKISFCAEQTRRDDLQYIRAGHLLTLCTALDYRRMTVPEVCKACQLYQTEQKHRFDRGPPV